MPDLNPLEWIGVWTVAAFVLVAGLILWDFGVSIALQVRDALAERRREDSDEIDRMFEPSYSICFCIQCNGKRNPLQDKDGRP
jgi:hypothetical protein